jgi:hypothetical protein
MASLEDGREDAIEKLNELEEEDSFVLVTQRTDEAGGADASFSSYAGDEPTHVNFVNAVGALYLTMHQEFDEYPLQEVASDSLKAAKLMAQGNRLSHQDE